jgi:hypothetical protein
MTTPKCASRKTNGPVEGCPCVVNHCPVTSATTIRLDVQGEVARMTFDRPEVLNADNAQFAADLGRAVAAINATPLAER